MAGEDVITGGTGYVGRPRIEALLSRGHRVRALARTGSGGRVPTGCEVVPGNTLDLAGLSHRVAPPDTFVPLIAAVGGPPPGIRVLEPPEIRAAVRTLPAARP
ncbi:MAG: NAD-dependent epimerase/dehydratase family protein [Acidobacteriota bacterium]